MPEGNWYRPPISEYGNIDPEGGKRMLDFLFLILFCWLFFKAIVLCLKAAWGLTKILASILFALAVPALIGCLLFAGGLLLLLPVGMMGLALLMLKSCT